MAQTVQTKKETTLCRRVIHGAAIELRGEKKNSLTFPASSEEPVERWYGIEVLSHEKGAIRLDRANRGAMPLLFNHNIDDPIGMVEAARIEKGRLVVDAQVFSTTRGAEILAMIEGGLRNVSIAYRSNVIEEDTKQEKFTVTDWEPYEVSIVTVPADPTVGIGRGIETEYEVRLIRSSQSAATPSKEGRDMDKDKENKDGGPVVTAQEPTPTPTSALELEKTRKRGIENLCKANKIDDAMRDLWIGQGLSVTQASDELLLILEERGKSNPQPASRLGMTNKERQQFSFIRAIEALCEKDWSKAGFELECSREVAKKLGKPGSPNRFFVPFEVLERPIEGRREKRDLTVATAGAGGYLVQTENVGFIEMLRNRSVAFRMGARRLSGLTGSVTVPRQSAAGTGYWLANEATAITESQQTFVQMALNPKTVGAYTEISRQLMLQSSPGAEGIVTDDLAQIVALAVDAAALNGSGASGQPLGIIGTSGIGSVTGTSLDFAGILNFQSDVATSNVVPIRGGYVTTPAVAALMMARVKFTNTASPLWEGNLWDGTMVGFPAMSSNQVPTADMIFGDWQELVIAEWGVLEVEVNPFANFQAGIIGVRAIYSVDIGVRRPFAYSLATSIT